MGRYLEGISRIVAAYEKGPTMVAALETLVETAQENARTEVGNITAAQVCEGIHEGPAHGLKCRTCYDVEQNMPHIEQVETELEMERQKEEKDG